MTTCARCGANLTQADLAQPACRYCGTVHAHYARAAEKVAVVNALMGDANRNGIPDALEGAAVLGGGGPPLVAPLPPGAHVVVSGSAVVIGGGAVPPATGGPMGGPAGGPVVHLYPQGGAPDVYAHARRGMNKMLLIALGVVVALMVLTGAALFAFAVFLS